MDKTAESIQKLITEYGKSYPDCWKKVELAAKYMREGMEGKAQVNIPDFVHIPMVIWNAFLFQGDQGLAFRKKESHAVNTMLMVSALGSWRLTQGIYRFDFDLGQSLIDTPWQGKIAWEQLMQLPEWCIYIEDPGYTATEDKKLFVFETATQVHGYFVQLDCDLFQNIPMLRIVVHLGKSFMPVCIPLGDWTLNEAMEKFETIQHEQMMGTYSRLIEDYHTESSNTRRVMERVLSLTYYICSQYAELGNGSQKPKRAQPVKTKKGMTYFPPDKPKVWDVGAKLGRALRAAKEREQQEQREYEQSGDKLRNRPRPHIRRAHWHTFLSGPRTEQQKRMVKWIPPTGVNLDYGEVIPTIYPIKENVQ